MDVVRPLVRVDRFEIHDVPDDVELVAYPVAPVHVARDTGDVERFAARVALHERHHLRRRGMLVHEPPDAERPLEAERDLRLHVRELPLYELVGRERPAELRALERVAARRVPAELRRAERAPRDPVARLVETAERT